MSFTIEWPMVTHAATAGAGIPVASAAFRYDATEWDALESVQLELVAKLAKRKVRVTVDWRDGLIYHPSLIGGVTTYCSGSAGESVVLEFLEGESASTTQIFTVQTDCTNVQGKITVTVTASESAGQTTVTIRYDKFECTTSGHGVWLTNAGQDTITFPVGQTEFFPVREFDDGVSNPPFSYTHAWKIDNPQATSVYVFPSVTVRLTPGGLGALAVNSATASRLLSGDFKASLTSGTTYRLEVVDSAGVGVAIYGARLLIRQSNAATKTIIPFEIGHYFTTNSIIHLDVDPLAYYQHVASRFAGAYSVFFEAEGSGSSNIALRDVAGNVITSVSTSGSGRSLVRSAEITLTDGERYKVSVRSVTGVVLYSARVLLRFSSMSRIAIPRSILEVQDGVGTSSVNTLDFFYWDPAQYSGSRVEDIIVEHMIRAATGVTVTSALWDGSAELGVVTSVSGGHDLYISPLVSLSSTAQSYWGRARASGANSMNRVRLRRVLVSVVFGVLAPPSLSMQSSAHTQLYGFEGEVFWPLLGKEVTLTSAVTWQSNTRRLFRPSRMDRVRNDQAIWMVIYTRSAGTHTIRLKGQAAGTIASFSAASGTQIYTTSVPISSLGNGDPLFVEVASSGTNPSLTLHYSALVFPLAGPSRFEQVIELGTEGKMTSVGSLTGKSRFLWDARYYPPGALVRFHATLKGAGRAELLRDDGIVVAEVAAGPTLSYVETAPIELEHGREYYVRYVSTGGGIDFGGAGLSIEGPGGDRALFLADLAHEFSQAVGTAWTRYALGVSWRSSNWKPVYDTVYEVSAGADFAAETAVGSGSDAPITESIVAVGTALARLRSATMALPTGSDVRVLSRRVTASTTTITQSKPRLLVFVGTASPVLVALPNEIVAGLGLGEITTADILSLPSVGALVGVGSNEVAMAFEAPGIGVTAFIPPGVIYLEDVLVPSGLGAEAGLGSHRTIIEYLLPGISGEAGLGSPGVAFVLRLPPLGVSTGIFLPAIDHGPSRVALDVGELRVFLQSKTIEIRVKDRIIAFKGDFWYNDVL